VTAWFREWSHKFAHSPKNIALLKGGRQQWRHLLSELYANAQWHHCDIRTAEQLMSVESGAISDCKKITISTPHSKGIVV